MPTNYKQLRKEYHDWLENRYRVLAGHETPPGEGDPPSGDPEGDAGDPAGGGEADPEGGDPNANDDTAQAYSKLLDDYRKKEKELGEAQAAIIREKAEAKKARDAAAEKGGDWEAVAKQRKSEAEDAVERAIKAEADRSDALNELEDFKRTVRVTSIAQRLLFRDPVDAIALLAPDDMSDDATAERALRGLADRKPYLVDQRRATGRETTGTRNGGAPQLSKEQIDAMSPEEVNANWDAIQEFMKNQQKAPASTRGG